MMSVIVKPMATPDARTRMIQSTAVLIRERGVEGTSFADVIEHSGAPRGSIYHHFPGGKAQLVEEATAFAGDLIAAGLARALETKEPAVAIRRFVQTWRRALEESDLRRRLSRRGRDARGRADAGGPARGRRGVRALGGRRSPARSPPRACPRSGRGRSAR